MTNYHNIEKGTNVLVEYKKDLDIIETVIEFDQDGRMFIEDGFMYFEIFENGINILLDIVTADKIINVFTERGK